VLEVAFIGNKGTRLWGAKGVFSEYDGLPASMLSMGAILNDSVSMHPQFKPYTSFPDDLSVAQALRPYPQYYGVEEQFPYNTNSNYNSLQVTATRRLTKGLGFLAAYTWSKAIGYVDANGPGAYYATVKDYYNRRLERSVTEFNYPQDFKLTWVYETPVGKGRSFDLHWANWVLGGWQLAAIHHYVSGGPVAVGESDLLTPTGFGSIRPDILSGQKLTLSGAPTKVNVNDEASSAQNYGAPYLNLAAFSTVPQDSSVPLRVGTAPRFLPYVRGPHSMSETFRMSKKFPLSKREGTFFGLGMTMTNPFNRIGRYILTTDVTDREHFGEIYAGGGGRTIQLDGRIEF